MFWKKSKPTERTLTGVRTVLSAAHRCQRTGSVHGHTWEITAWFLYNGTDQSVRRYQLERTLKPYDHTCLPDSIAWGEALAKFIGHNIENGWGTGDPALVAVDVNRPLEGIFARWEALT